LRYAAKDTQHIYGKSIAAAGMEIRNTWTMVLINTAQSIMIIRKLKNVEWRPKKRYDHPTFSTSWKIKRIRPNFASWFFIPDSRIQ
jgi:hypothetical protein